MGPDQPSTRLPSRPGLPVRTRKVTSRPSSRRGRLARGSEWRGQVCGDGSRHHTASCRAGLHSLRRGQPWTPAEVDPLTSVSTLPCQQNSPKGPVSTRQSAQVGASLRPGDRPPSETAQGPTPPPHLGPRAHPHGRHPRSPQVRTLTGSISMVPGGPGSPSAPGRPGRPGGPCGQRGQESGSTHRAELGWDDATGRSQETRETQDPGRGMCTPQAQKRGLHCGLRTGSRGIRDTKAGACRGGGAWRAEATLREVLGLPRPQE